MYVFNEKQNYIPDWFDGTFVNFTWQGEKKQKHINIIEERCTMWQQVLQKMQEIEVSELHEIWRTNFNFTLEGTQVIDI